MKLFRIAYDWVLHWAKTPYALPALCIISFVESSFFPVPPDVLLIAMTVAIPTSWIRFSLFCSLSSVLGGIFGYFIGYQFMELIGQEIINFYHLQETFDKIGGLYNDHQGWAVAAAGFTPLPYKVFTLAAGTFKIDLATFIVASAISRSARFFLVGFLIYKFGPPIKALIEKYFNIFSIVFFVLLVLGFYLVKFVI